LRELVYAVAAEDLAPTEANVNRLQEYGPGAGSGAVSLRLAGVPPEATALTHTARTP
jgi:hypothetical protein